MSQKKPTVILQDEMWFEWFVRRSEFEVNVYRVNADGTRGGIVSKLGYPKVTGIGFTDFMREATVIAKRELAEYPDCAHDGPHTNECRRGE